MPDAYQIETRREEYLRYLSDIATPIDKWEYKYLFSGKMFRARLPSKTSSSVHYTLYFIEEATIVAKNVSETEAGSDTITPDPFGKLHCIVKNKGITGDLSEGERTVLGWLIILLALAIAFLLSSLLKA